MTDLALSRIAAQPVVSHADMANAIRFLAIDAVENAKSGHPGMPMGMADVATVLFSRFLKFDASDPAWPDRDRFVLSAGHGSMLLYALLHLTGYAGVTMDELKAPHSPRSAVHATSKCTLSLPVPTISGEPPSRPCSAAARLASTASMRVA